MFFFLFHYLVVQGQVTYDSGLFLGFDYVENPIFSCMNGKNYTQQITFSQPFANPPKIILAREYTDLAAALNLKQLQISFQITNQTTSFFELFIKCNELQVYVIRLRWYAIDDQRIQVLSFFDVYSFQNQTFDHMNPNAVAGFVSIISLGFKGPFEFNIILSQITPTQASVQFTDPKSNIGNVLSMSYQIILVPPDQLNFISNKWLTANWNSSNITVIPKTFFMVPPFGYRYDNVVNFRLRTNYFSNDPIIYGIETFGGAFTSFFHNQIQLYYSFNKTYLPLFCNHFEAIQKVDLAITSSVKMLILETNQQFSSIGSYSIILDQMLSTINFEIAVKCLETQIIQSSFYIFISQMSQIQQTQYVHSCSSQYKTIIYYPRFKQQIFAYEQLQIVIESNSITITQINIYNQYEVSNQQLVAITII